MRLYKCDSGTTKKIVIVYHAGRRFCFNLFLFFFLDVLIGTIEEQCVNVTNQWSNGSNLQTALSMCS